ncbi:MAG: PKD domain-containing protein [Thermoplasmatales archaeon]|nr:PKD domain-containing protein [Thermoplasmatales archaeon]
MKKLLVLSLAIIMAMPVIASDPIVDFDWYPATPSSGEVVHFNDTSQNQSQIIDRVWYFGDGYGATTKNPTHIYEKPGNYTVKLVVLWNISGTIYGSSREKTIVILNRPPVANAGPDQILNVRNVTFDASASYDPDGNITAYNWDFGDGSTGSGKILTHIYAIDGNFTVVLNVTDNNGSYATDICNVTIDTVAPVTECVLNGTSGENGWYISDVNVTFNVTDATSGVNKTFYRLDGGNWTVYNGTFNISSEGIHLLEFYSTDVAGNSEEIKNVTIKIDKTSPSISIITPEERKFYVFGRKILPTLRKTIIVGKITVEASASDNIGINMVKFYVNEEEKYNDTEPPYEWRWGGAIGSKNLTVIAYDYAGLNSFSSIEVTIFSLFKPWSENALLEENRLS